MKIEIYLDENEYGTPMELANALIKTMFKDANDSEMLTIKRIELAEFVEHIQAFLKYSEVRDAKIFMDKS